ncbi:MAG: hypothetical protein APR55_04240 [Methanolinea sp. SDB]|nr:MAG: hypothetical protein APR55_04240 [Methanolinea sp. SDB]
MISILYVDDEVALLEITRLYLEKTGGLTVETADSAADGLKKIQESFFDVIVSDYQMPEMDGIAFLKAVRQRFGDIPFILFTGKGREEVVIEAINNGVDFYIQKGGHPKSQFAELAHKIQQAVSRRKADLSRIESEKRLADIINFLPDATFAIDRSGEVIIWNRAIEDLTGIPASDMLGKGNYEYAIPFYGTRRKILIDLISEPVDTIERSYTNIMREKDILIADTTLPRPRGMKTTLMGKASPLYSSSGEIVGAIETIRDITERQMAEDELRAAYEQIAANDEILRLQLAELSSQQSALNESEQRFRELADLLPQGIYETDLSGCITYANRMALEMTGYSEEDVTRGQNALLVIAPEDRGRASALFQRNLEGEIHHQGTEDFSVLRKDGTTFHVSIFSSPIFRDGTIAGVRGVLMDITERKRIEEDLVAINQELAVAGEELKAQYDALAGSEKQIRESEVRLQYMLGFYEKLQGPENELLSYAVEGAGAITGSPLGYLAFLNDGETELAMYAWSKTSMKECSMREKPIFYPVEKTGLWGEAVRQRRPVVTNDYQAPNPAKKGYPPGHPHIACHMNVPIMDGGHIVIVAGVANRSTDYTDQEVNALTLLMQGLWQVLKMRRAEVELRAANKKLNLLSSITRHDVANQLTIIKGLVDIAGMKESDTDLADLTTKIKVAAEKICHQIEFTRRYQDLGIHRPEWFRLDDIIEKIHFSKVHYSSACRDVEIFADPMLDRVFFNLFENAIRHGGRVTRIAVDCVPASGGLVITIEDDGVGIAPGLKEKVFEKGHGNHTGYGLFLTREILAITGIGIHETGVHGTGARFEITVPPGMFRYLA